MAQFFVICPLGFADELEVELQEFWPYLIDSNTRPHCESLKILAKEPGGILIETSEMLGYQINYFSKIASRVLERVTEFKVRDFPKLNAKLVKLDLKPWFRESAFNLEVAASQSRLNNEKRIAEVFKSVFKLDENSLFTLQVRMNQDICTVSVDTSGRHLHFRNPVNVDKWIGEAPLRETIAAFMIRKISEGVTLSEISDVSLWDPMAGSGTLISEAAALHEPNLGREFAFQSFSKCPKILKLDGLRSNYPQFSFYFKEYRASDLDEKIIKGLENNLKQISNKKIFQENYFENKKLEQTNEKVWIVLNPPYNERLEFQEGYHKLGEQLSASRAERVGVLTPQSKVKELEKELSNYSILSKTKLKNGGIPVEFLVFAK